MCLKNRALCLLFRHYENRTNYEYWLAPSKLPCLKQNLGHILVPYSLLSPYILMPTSLLSLRVRVIGHYNMPVIIGSIICEVHTMFQANSVVFLTNSFFGQFHVSVNSLFRKFIFRKNSCFRYSHFRQVLISEEYILECH